MSAAPSLAIESRGRLVVDASGAFERAVVDLPGVRLKSEPNRRFATLGAVMAANADHARQKTATLDALSRVLGVRPQCTTIVGGNPRGATAPKRCARRGAVHVALFGAMCVPHATKARALDKGRPFEPLLPLSVTVTRRAPSLLDDDNIWGATKYVRDAIAEYFGITDGPGPFASWRSAQEKTKAGIYAVRIEIERGAAC